MARQVDESSTQPPRVVLEVAERGVTSVAEQTPDALTAGLPRRRAASMIVVDVETAGADVRGGVNPAYGARTALRVEHGLVRLQRQPVFRPQRTAKGQLGVVHATSRLSCRVSIQACCARRLTRIHVRVIPGPGSGSPLRMRRSRSRAQRAEVVRISSLPAFAAWPLSSRYVCEVSVECSLLSVRVLWSGGQAGARRHPLPTGPLSALRPLARQEDGAHVRLPFSFLGAPGIHARPADRLPLPPMGDVARWSSRAAVGAPLRRARTGEGNLGHVDLLSQVGHAPGLLTQSRGSSHGHFTPGWVQVPRHLGKLTQVTGCTPPLRFPSAECGTTTTKEAPRA